MGHHSGGNIVWHLDETERTTTDVANTLWKFDPKVPHETDHFNGSRICIVAFKSRSLSSATPATQVTLDQLGFCRLKEANATKKEPKKCQDIRNRIHHFYHDFAGPVGFNLGEAVVEEATRRGIKAEHVSSDLLRDRTDLLKDEPFRSNLEKAKAHEVDGYHAGFPCSSFTRLRFRASRLPGMKGPVRSAEHILGLPTNTPDQQREADEGTELAKRSTLMCNAVRDAAVERGLEPVATMENPAPPLDDERLPSALYLPFIVELLKLSGAAMAALVLCAYGAFAGNPPLPIYKDSLWFGFLKGLETLSTNCSCTTFHATLTDPATARKAALYPKKLCTAYATLVVDAWERNINTLVEKEIRNEKSRVESPGKQSSKIKGLWWGLPVSEPALGSHGRTPNEKALL